METNDLYEPGPLLHVPSYKRWKLQRRASPRWKVSELQMLWRPRNRKGGTVSQYYELVSTKYPSNGLGVNVNIPSVHKYIHCSQVHTVCSQAPIITLCSHVHRILCAHKFIGYCVLTSSYQILCAHKFITHKFLPMRLCSHELLGLSGLLRAHLGCSVLRMFGCVSSWSYRCSSTSLPLSVILQSTLPLPSPHRNTALGRGWGGREVLCLVEDWQGGKGRSVLRWRLVHGGQRTEQHKQEWMQWEEGGR